MQHRHTWKMEKAILICVFLLKRPGACFAVYIVSSHRIGVMSCCAVRIMRAKYIYFTVKNYDACVVCDMLCHALACVLYNASGIVHDVCVLCVRCRMCCAFLSCFACHALPCISCGVIVLCRAYHTCALYFGCRGIHSM